MKPTPCECMAPFEPVIPMRQLSLRQTFIIDLGTRQWLVLHLDTGQLVESLLLNAFPSLEFTARLRSQGVRIQWSAVGNLPL